MRGSGFDAARAPNGTILNRAERLIMSRYRAAASPAPIKTSLSAGVGTMIFFRAFFE